MTAIFVLRHPQTTWNRAERYQGRLDAPLSAEGRRQVALTAAVFRGEALDSIITSPLSRSRHLADALAIATGAPVRTDSRLTEMAQGTWEGLHLSDIQARFPDQLAQWKSRPDLLRFPGGEALSDVECRTSAAFEDIYNEFPGGTVAVVSHSVVVQVVASRSLHIDLRFLHGIKISNASITTVCGTSWPGSLLSLNVTQALDGSPVAGARAEGCGGSSMRRQTT